MSEISSLVDKLNKDYNEDFKIDLPNVKDVKVDPLTFSQQKQLIGSIADGAASSLKLQKILSDIVIENIKSDDDIFTTDKLAVVLQLRQKAIGNEVVIGDDKHDILDELIDNSLKIKKPKAKKIKYKNIVIHTRVPTLKYEGKILNASIEVLKKDGEKNFGKSVGELFTHEIIKYISCVEVGDEKIEDFEKLSIQDRCAVVNNLPVALNKLISDHIQSIKKQEFDALAVEIDGEKISVDIDVSFFDS